jgi:predicted nucleotidyltransferase
MTLVPAPDVVLDAIVRLLTDAYHPDRIYLFGSAARGDATADSDLDFLIVVPDDAIPERRTVRLGYEALWGLPVAADIVVWTRSAFDRRCRVPASLPATVLREGRLLHAA